MNITTREGRKELRRLCETEPELVTWAMEALSGALDGLDIAERIVWPIRVIYWLTCHEAFLPVEVWLKYHGAAQNALTQAIAEWDEWCS